MSGEDEEGNWSLSFLNHWGWRRRCRRKEQVWGKEPRHTSDWLNSWKKMLHWFVFFFSGVFFFFFGFFFFFFCGQFLESRHGAQFVPSSLISCVQDGDDKLVCSPSCTALHHRPKTNTSCCFLVSVKKCFFKNKFCVIVVITFNMRSTSLLMFSTAQFSTLKSSTSAGIGF